MRLRAARRRIARAGRRKRVLFFIGDGKCFWGGADKAKHHDRLCAPPASGQRAFLGPQLKQMTGAARQNCKSWQRARKRHVQCVIRGG